MKEWLDRAITLLQGGRNCVLVTVVATEGSTPRETGSKMLVLEQAIEGSIGGGHLEFKAIQQARAMLEATRGSVELAEFALGPSLGQCCGGQVQLMLERVDSQDLPWLRRWRTPLNHLVLVTDLANGAKTVIEADGRGPAGHLGAAAARLIEAREPVRLMEGLDGQPCYVLEQMKSSARDIFLFGAGHVGRALVHVLSGLPYRIRWFDARPGMFPAEVPGNVVVESSADPRHDVASAPSGTLFLVMTHSHALDFDICDQVLRRSDFEFLGLIGSATKRATFVRRLRLRGHSDASIRRLTCPIGLPAIGGKAPAAVAISVAGQLLSLSQAKASDRLAAIVKGRKKA
jgi:xanthine dehydrogenase accessory factor